MNNEIKLSLSVTLLGSVIVSQPDKAENIVSSVSVIENGKKMIHTNSQRHIPKIEKPASQVINMTVDAYDTMVSSKDVPHGVRNEVWKGMSLKQRLEYNLQRTCEFLGGISYSYELFE